ncbi:MAG TPA: efflux RND transporter periplasmic adaptor subunit [Chitinispirillaceae bacterium]|nr:efflux RND transporter periplasmic adaptor subunit [Chitinispirillaceae bacterium]
MKGLIRAFALGSIILVACQKPVKTEKPVEVKLPVAVEGIRAMKGVIDRDMVLSGIASGIREVTVTSETQGILKNVNFELGRKVQSGTVLVSVDETVQKATYEQAKAAHVSALLQLNVTKKLYEGKNASEAEFNNAQLQESSAAAALKAALKSLNDTKVLAPISGFIAQKDISMTEGNYLSAGSAVTRIVDISSLKAMLMVGELEIGQIKVGTPVDVVVTAVNKSFQGKVSAIAAGNDPATGSYAVEVEWKNSADLQVKSGMSVKVTIGTTIKDTAIFIPAFSIVEKEYKKAVFVVTENKAALRFVNTGKTSGSQVAILGGISEGDIVLTSGMTTLGRGDSLIVTMTGESGGAR